MSVGSNRDGLCGQCRTRDFLFQRAVPLGPYAGLLRDLVILMKEPRAHAIAAATGAMMADRVLEACQGDLPEFVTFVPMHWRRRLRRRANNPERLARSVGRTLRLPVDSRVIRCLRTTEKQSLLTPAERFHNVRNAFGVVRAKRPIAGRHIGIVDDTMTTGATANEISRILLNAGAARITIILAARGVIM